MLYSLKNIWLADCFHGSSCSPKIPLKILIVIFFLYKKKSTETELIIYDGFILIYNTVFTDRISLPAADTL